MATGRKAYLIIEFIKEKRKNTISVYAVPSRWLKFDKNTYTLYCKFMEPPYDDERQAVLRKLIATNADAPQTWKAYPATVRGDADTFDEAEHKVAAFLKNDSAYAFSTSDENHAAAKSAQVEKSFRDDVHGRRLSLNSIMYESGDDSSEAEVEESSFEKDSPPKKKPTKGKSSNSNIHGNSRKQQSNADILDTAEAANHEFIEPHGIDATVVPNAPQSSAAPGIREKKISNAESACISRKQKEYPELPKNGPIQPNNTGEAVLSPRDLVLLKAIKALSVEVQMQGDQIRQLRRAIVSALKVRVDDMSIQKFIEKHNVVFKLENVEALTAFDEQLANDEQLSNDFKLALRHLVDKDMATTMVTVLKRIIHRQLALKLTAVRKTKDKFVVKDLCLTAILFDLVCAEHQGQDGKTVTEKQFNKTLGAILNNAKDWDGHRKDRQANGGTKDAAVDNPTDNE